MKACTAPRITRIFLIAMAYTMAGTVAAAPTLEFAPAAGTARPGTLFTSAITASAVVDLYAYQFSVTFDPAVLQAVAIREGPFLPAAGSTGFVPGTIDNIAGTISFTGNTLLSAITGANGTGALALVDFTAVREGASALSFADVLFLDSLFNPIAINSATGLITVASTTNINTARPYYPTSGVGTAVNPIFEGGTLRVDVSGTYRMNFTLNGQGGTLDSNGQSAIFSGVFSDAVPGIPGALTITDNLGGGPGGVVILTGANTYTGGTIVNQGTLSVQGTLASGVTVNTGGTLRGTGWIGGQSSIAGRLAPGNSPGTLTFAAPLAMVIGSTLQIDIDGTGQGTGAGNYSRVLVVGAGNTFTAAGTLEPILRGIMGSATNTYTPAIGQSFSIVTATGGVLGTFDGLTQPVAGLALGTRFDALYDPNAVRLAVTPTTYASLPNVALSGNAQGVGGALDAARPAAYAPKNALFQSLAVLSEPQVADALQQLSGEVYADLVAASFNVHRLPRQTIFGHLDDLRLGRVRPSPAVLTGEGDGNPAGQVAGGLARMLDATPNRRLWVQGIGGRVDTDGDGNALRFGERLYGVVGGCDLPVGERFQVGLAVAYGHDRVDANQVGTGEVSTWQAIGYGLWQQDGLFANLALGYGWDDYSANRPVAFSSVGGYTTTTGGQSEFADLEGGLRRRWGDYLIEPTLGLRADFIRRNGLTEPGLAGLTLDAQSYQAIQTRLGAKLSRDFAIGHDRHVTPELRIYWRHDFGDTASIDAAAAILGQPFTVRAPGVDRDALLLGLGLAVDAGKDVALFLDYNLTYNSRQTGQNLLAGLLVRW